jgi:hypothetical protein
MIKVVGSELNRSYNPSEQTFMWLRYILSFLIFVVGLEIGALADLYAVRAALPEDELENLTEVVDRIPTREPCILRDSRPLVIEHNGSRVSGNLQIEYYVLTNTGIEPIYLETDEHSLKLAVYLFAPYWGKEVKGEVLTRELPPGGSSTLSISISPDDKYFNFGFKYQLGNRFRTRTAIYPDVWIDGSCY